MDSIDDLLTCVVCQNWFQSPRRLPCHHVYCLRCLRGLFIKGTGIAIICPECRVEHIVPDRNVDEFPEDGQLKQFIAVQRKQIQPKCQECKQVSLLTECDHCQQQTCTECQTKHGNELKESLMRDLEQFKAEFFTEEQIAFRQQEKVKLLECIENLGTFKETVEREIDDLIKQLERRRSVILERLDREEEAVLNDLSKLDQTQNNGA